MKAKKPNKERPVLTIRETAKCLGISASLAYRLAERGELPVLRLGGRRVVPRVALEKMLNSVEAKNV